MLFSNSSEIGLNGAITCISRW